MKQRRAVMKRVRAKSKMKRVVAKQTNPKPRKTLRKTVSKRVVKPRLLKAIEGSGGIKSVVLQRLGCTYATLNRCLEKWPDAEEAMQAEREFVGDLAESAIIDAMRQRIDISAASRTAQWLLTRARYKDRGFEDLLKRMSVEGGDKPIQMEVVNIEALKLPLDVRRRILEAAEAAEAEAAQANDEDEE